METQDLNRITHQLSSARCAVAFTGAGISTSSGIADFRSPGGVWTRYRTVYYDEFLSDENARREYWQMKKELFPEFAAAKPNPGHYALARLEQAGLLKGIITQNIDGLHSEAGSRRVLEIHGTGKYVECINCDKRWPAREIFDQYKDREDIPTCDRCSGLLKPATVSFGQMLPEDVVSEAQELCEQADCMLAIGSSLVVEPAASFPVHAQQTGAFLAIINREATPVDDLADAIIRDPIDDALDAIVRQLSL
jgi:NAD-dependent deacetylase